MVISDEKRAKRLGFGICNVSLVVKLSTGSKAKIVSHKNVLKKINSGSQVLN